MKHLLALLKGNRPVRWRVIDQSFYSIFITFSLIELTNVSASLIDGLIVSNSLSSEAMAASGIAHPIFCVSGIFGGMLATGMQTLCTRELGSGDVPGFNRLFSAAMYLGTIFSVILTGVLFLAAEPFVAFLGASGNAASLAGLAAQYLRGVLIGLPALIMSGVLASAVQMDSGRRRVMSMAVITSVLNILLDFAAVAAKTGIFGIGLATSLAQYIGMGYLFLHFRREDNMLCFVKLSTSVKEMQHLLSCGTEKTLRRLSNLIRPVFINHLIVYYGGTMAMTAMSVNNSISDFTRFFAVGVADATALLVGVLYGEMNESGIEESVKCALYCCAQFCGCVAVIFFIFARPIARLYISEDGELLNMMVFVIRMTALQAPLNGILQPRISYLQAIGHTKNMQILTILYKLGYVILAAFVLGVCFGTYGILASFLVSDVLTLLTVWVYHCVKARKLLPNLKELLALPEHFRRSPGDVIELEIKDYEDISLTSMQIMMFCKGHMIDEKTSYSASLCFEELAANVIKHGFPKCKMDPGIDLRLVYDSGTLIIRMQDNCAAFNLEKQISYAVNDNSLEPDKKLGLRLLGNMAANIKYVHSLETNNVILRYPVEPAAVTD